MKQKILGKIFKKRNTSTKTDGDTTTSSSGMEKVARKCVKCKCEKQQCKCIHRTQIKTLPTNAFHTSILD